MIYFRRTLLDLARDCLASLVARKTVGQSNLAWAVLFGTIPAGIAGLLFRHQIETTLRSPLTVASTTIGFGALLLVADRLRGQRQEHAVNWLDVLVIGCAQALALVPGTSRSGVTITAGLIRGLSRAAAARFSFLLAVPVMTAAGLAELAGYSGGGGERADVAAMVARAIISALTGIACIHYFLKWLTRFGLWPYVLYRLVLGLTLFVLVR